MNKTDKADRLKRMKMRSWRRGTKEMDLILGPFADSCLAEMSPPDLDLYEVLLSENDQDLYQWVTAPALIPVEYKNIMHRITERAAVPL